MHDPFPFPLSSSSRLRCCRLRCCRRSAQHASLPTAQSATERVDARNLDALVHYAMQPGPILKATIAVVQDGAVAHVNAYGLAGNA